MAQRMTNRALAVLACGVSGLLLYIGCGQEFTGKGPRTTKKKLPTNETPTDRETPVGPTPPSGSGSITITGEGGPATPDAISLTIIQTQSEAWWKNCLEARTDSSESWVPVACNKDSGAVGRTVQLPGRPGTCNSIRLRINTFKNMGDDCSQRAARGLSCDGPYPGRADFVRGPEDSPENYRTYDESGIRSPDALIRANAQWSLPDFENLSRQMTEFLGPQQANHWLRVFFEDQLSTQIDRVRSAATSGIDYNDYVFDVKGENIKFQIEGSGPTCGPFLRSP